MRILIFAVALVSALTVPIAGVAAQRNMEAALSEFEDITESIIRIRTIADLEYERTDRSTGESRVAIRPYSVDGSGIVVGEMEVDGRTEYLILTNHHVADASNYVLEEGGYLRVNPTNTLALPSVNEESYLMKQSSETISDEDIRLIEVVRLVRGDMTLMRTEGANRELRVFEGRIGSLDGEVAAGAAILTSGFPWGGKQIVAVGTIIETDFPHDLGLAHADYLIDLRVEPGQSGGPIFLIESDPSEANGVELRLIGLVHAKDRERSYGVPYTLWKESLDEFPAQLQDRLVRKAAAQHVSKD